MSKLYKKYLSLKIEDSNYFYLFENGIFYIFIAEDAEFMARELNLKLTNLSPRIVKCGFPVSQLDKYLALLKSSNHNVKIVNSNSYLAYSQKDYISNNNVKDLLKRLANSQPDELSISQVYDLLNDFSTEAKNIIKQIEDNL